MRRNNKDNGRTIPEGKNQVNFNISQETLEKVKNLAFWEGIPQTEIYNRSVVRFIELWEEKHGEIQPKPSGKGLDSV